MNAGTQKNTKYILANDVAKSMCGNLLDALIPFHTLKGCDTTSFIALNSKSTNSYQGIRWRYFRRFSFQKHRKVILLYIWNANFWWYKQSQVTSFPEEK